MKAIHPRTGEMSEVIFTYVTTHHEYIGGHRFGKIMWVLRYRFTDTPDIPYWQPILVEGNPARRRRDFGMFHVYAAAEVVLGRKLTPAEESTLLADKYPEFRRLLNLDGQRWDAQYNDLTPQEVAEATARVQRRIGFNAVCHSHQVTETIPYPANYDKGDSKGSAGGGTRVIRGTKSFS